MLESFDKLPDTARIWIYQADRQIPPSDATTINELTSEFLTQWAAHGTDLKSGFSILHDRFLIIAIDETFNQASGCSIDASVALVKTLENKVDIKFFDRTKVCFLSDGNLFDCSMTNIKALIEKGEINQDTPTFNNLVANLGELKNGWIVPSSDSWLSRYF